MKDLIEMYDGIRVVGDIHGHSKEFKTVVKDAKDKNLFVLSLGDLADRGPDSPGVLEDMDRLVQDGAGAFIVGNHDDKLYRWSIGNKVSVGNGMSKTIEQLDAIPDKYGYKNYLMDRFRNNIEESYLWAYLVLFGNQYLFVHGAYNPGMIGDLAYASVGPKYTAKKKYGGLSSLALYAESSGKTKPNGYPERTYNWTDKVYSGLTVFIGHDYVSDDVILLENDLGGKVYMMDTGSGKGGRLSYIDIVSGGIDYPDDRILEYVKGKDELTKLIAENYFTKSGD